MSKKFQPYTKAEKRELSIEQRVSRLIARCFNDVNFGYQVFNCGDYKMKSESGETRFYESTPIDKAIRKVNRVNAWLIRQGKNKAA